MLQPNQWSPLLLSFAALTLLIACSSTNTPGTADEGPTSQQRWVKLAIASEKMVCLLRNDKRVYCWGEAAPAASNPIPGTFTDLTSSFRQGCGLTEDGEVECWRSRNEVRSWADLGPPPRDINFKSINGQCGVTVDDKLSCWKKKPKSQTLPPGMARKLYRQMGIDPKSVSTETPLDKVEAVREVSADCVVDASSAVVCRRAELQPPVGAYHGLSVWGSTACAIRDDGFPVCWGRVLGNVPSEKVSAIAAGDENACAITEAGSIVCWGTKRAQGIFGPPPEGQFVELDLAEEFGCAIEKAGGVRCWGMRGRMNVSILP